MKWFSSVLAVLLATITLGCSSINTIKTERSIVLDLREQLGIQGNAKLLKATAYHGRYYCLFSYSSMYAGSGNLMEVVDMNSLSIKELPSPTKRIHYLDDLFVRHDTLFYHHYGSWKKNDLFFDTMSRSWIPCATVDHLIAEDEDYHVYAMDNGEFGQSTWFVNRATGREYVVWGIGDVRRVDDTYFIVNNMSVRGVSLSQLSKAQPSPIGYPQAKKSYDAIRDFANVAIDADTFYRDPKYSGFEEYIGAHRDTLIVGSMVDERGLLLLTQLPEGVRLMRISDSTRLIAVDTTCLALSYKQRGSLKPMRGGLHTDCLLLAVQSDALNSSLIDIQGRRVSVLNIHHLVDTLPLCKTDGLDSLVAFLSQRWDSLYDSQLISFESANGTTFIMEDSLRNGYFEEIGLTDSICRTLRFKKRVDTLYNLEIEFCILKESRRLAAVFLDFSLPQPYLSESLWNRMSLDQRRTWSAYKAADMISRLDTLCGPHLSYDNEIVWLYGPLTLCYYPSSNRLLIH
ncbi:MAG: hypothetical protein IKH97_06515 [Bacteroidales bacterium]|nr:hypothetical protein [Bacteroidales bacterium]